MKTCGYGDGQGGHDGAIYETLLGVLNRWMDPRLTQTSNEVGQKDTEQNPVQFSGLLLFIDLCILFMFPTIFEGFGDMAQGFRKKVGMFIDGMRAWS